MFLYTIRWGRVSDQCPSAWTTSFVNELGRLVDGVGERMKYGTNKVRFIPRHLVPKGHTVTYRQLVCDFRTHKEEKHRTRLIVGED